MARLAKFAALLFLASLGGIAEAKAQSAAVPYAAWFGGLGGSYGSVSFGTQNVYAVGTVDIYSGGMLVASGSAAGPATVYTTAQSGFAPSAQAGYFQHVADSRWLWGAKFTYSYLHSTSTTPNALIPQVGSFTSGGTTTAFTGTAVVASYQVAVNHQTDFLLFGGRSFDRVTVYLGAGPSLSQLQTRLNGVVGFADINGMHTEITTQPTNFFSSQWVFGGAATVGATYFLNPDWFLDMSYTFDATGNQSGKYFSTFGNSSEVGTLSGTSSGRAIAQTFTVSINARFDQLLRAGAY